MKSNPNAVTGAPGPLHSMMRNWGKSERLSPNLLEAILQLEETRLPRAKLLQKSRKFFLEKAILAPKGLDTLPSAWLEKIPQILWATRKAEWKVLPYFIRKLSYDAGILSIQFHLEPNGEGRHNTFTRWDRLRLQVNYSLRPSLWHWLDKAEERRIWDARPELRMDLFTVR